MQTRRVFTRHALAFATALLAGGRLGRIDTAAASPAAGGTPVILDTDIGDDMDDTWALLMLLRMPQLDLKLAVGDFGNAIYRGRLLAKLLDHTGYSDVPIGIGMGGEDEPGRQSGWIGNYQLADYPGVIKPDGVQALIDTINESPTPVTLIGIGPVPNIAEALRRDPSIADNARFVGMQGSVFVGYDGAPEPAAEWNVKVDPKSLQKVFAAPWDCTITPLDTCGMIRLEGERYRAVRDAKDPVMRAVIDNYRIWARATAGYDPDAFSSILFDTVAVYLAFTTKHLEMERMGVRVTDEGFTVADDHARPMNVAVNWRDLDAYHDFLVERLLAAVVR